MYLVAVLGRVTFAQKSASNRNPGEQGVEVESTMRKTSNDMARQQQRMGAKADLYEKRHEAASKMVAMLREAVLHLFTKAGCNTATVRELLGDNGVTESNLLPHLGIVEQRTTELVHVRPVVHASVS